MDKFINLGIPHVGELIFENIDTPGLIQCLLVSETWKELAENVLLKRWKGKMFEACENGKTKVVQLLLERCNSEESGLNTKRKDGGIQDGVTTFMISCICGHKDIVQLFLDHSEIIDLNAKDDDGWTAFMWACTFGQKGVVQLLLDHSEKIDLHARDDDGSAFTLACKRGHKDVVQLLLDHSDRTIDPNVRGFHGRTAFMWACRNGHKDVVKLLLDHSERIDLNATDIHGRTALMIAHNYGHKDIVQLIKAKLNMYIDLGVYF